MIDPIDELSDKAFLSRFMVLYRYSLNLNSESPFSILRKAVFSQVFHFFKTVFGKEVPLAANGEKYG